MMNLNLITADRLSIRITVNFGSYHNPPRTILRAVARSLGSMMDIEQKPILDISYRTYEYVSRNPETMVLTYQEETSRSLVDDLIRQYKQLIITTQESAKRLSNADQIILSLDCQRDIALYESFIERLKKI